MKLLPNFNKNFSINRNKWVSRKKALSSYTKKSSTYRSKRCKSRHKRNFYKTIFAGVTTNPVSNSLNSAHIKNKSSPYKNKSTYTKTNFFKKNNLSTNSSNNNQSTLSTRTSTSSKSANSRKESRNLVNLLFPKIENLFLKPSLKMTP